MDQLGKICQHRWKERLYISKTAKFESDLLKTYKDIAHQGKFAQLSPPLQPYKHTVNPLLSLSGGTYLFQAHLRGGLFEMGAYLIQKR